MSTYRGALSRKLLCFSIVILNSFLLHSALRIKSCNALVDYTGLSRERVICLAHQHISYDVKMDFNQEKIKSVRRFLWRQLLFPFDNRPGSRVPYLCQEGYAKAMTFDSDILQKKSVLSAIRG